MIIRISTQKNTINDVKMVMLKNIGIIKNIIQNIATNWEKIS